MFDPSKPPQTLPELAHRSFSTFASRPYLGTKRDGKYEFATYAQIAARVRNLAGAFLEQEWERGERIAIIGESGVEWALIDLACQMCGLIVVPLFATLPASQVQTILEDCTPRVVWVADEKQRAKVEQIRENVPSIEQIFDFSAVADMEKSGAAFLEDQSGLYEQTWPAAYPDDVATIIYTSGTTGVPKGVMLSHKNLVANAEDIKSIAVGFSPDDVFLSFLPLAHVYERTAGHFFPLRLGASVAYCESLFTVDKNMAEVRPTIMTCVPRLQESSREKLFAAAKSLPESKRQKYLDALELTVKYGLHRGQFPGAPGLSLVEKLKLAVYDRLVLSKVREKFGGRLRHFISGGAPLSPELGALFIGLGMEVLEGYGLTETSPVIAVNRPNNVKLGTVGLPMPSVQVRIEADGEIAVSGPTVMKGYWQKPEETRAVLTSDGWFHTGDIGELKDGVLRITDRKKDLLVLANGKKVAPQPIELRLQESRYISQAVLLGDSQKSVTALLVPSFPALREWAAKQNLDVSKDEELAGHPEVNKFLRSEVELQTNDLADFEKIRRIVVLPEALSVQNGELTPTLKVKRRIVAEKYAELVS